MTLALVPPPLAGTLHRQVCPSCLLGLTDCQRCNGSGYVLKDPYDPRTSGEQRDEDIGLEQVDTKLKAEHLARGAILDAVKVAARRWGWVAPAEAEKAGDEPLDLVSFLNRRLEVAAAVIAKERA